MPAGPVTLRRTRPRPPGRVTHRTDPDRRPHVGPFGRCWWSSAERRWKLALTHAGKELVAAHLARYEPAPGAIAFQALRWLTPARLAEQGLTADDVHAAARMGVVTAALNYDPARGAFTTAAVWHIRSAAQRLVGRRAGEMEFFTNLVRPDHLGEPGGDPWGGLGLAARDGPAGPADPGGADPELAAALRALPARDRRAVELRFGLGGGGGRKLREIAAELGCTKERVRQILLRAVERLRGELAAGRGGSR